MSRMVRVIHRLSYSFTLDRFDTAADVRLRPLDGMRQRLLHHQLTTHPDPDLEMTGVDAFGNATAELAWAELPRLTVTAMSALELTLCGGRLDGVDPTPLVVGTPYAPQDERFAAMGRSIFGHRPIDASSLFQFAKQMRACLAYDARWAPIRRSAGDALRDGEGTAADYAHIAIAVLRSLGHAACYVSGYLLPPSGAGKATPHAWIAVHSKSRGWLEVDPMLGCPPDLRHVAVCIGGDRADVAPVQSQTLSRGICHVRQELTFYPLTRTSIPAPKALAS